MLITAENTYWNHNGKHQNKVTMLERLIPDSGSVPDPRKNPKLERFRKACNCYHDLYNNGLCNAMSEFRKVFGIAASHYRLRRYEFSQTLYDLVEKTMDEIIVEAFEEQSVNLLTSV